MTEEILLNGKDLAKRWRMSDKTLQKQRYLKIGPPYIKINSCVRYKLSDIELYEKNNTHLKNPTNSNIPSKNSKIGGIV